MTYLTFISTSILLLCFISQIYSIGIGKVFIGFMQNSSLSQDNSISGQPSLSSSSYNVPVYVKVFADGNSSIPLPFAVNVSIECETDRNDSGFSIATFSPLTLSGGNPQGVITIRLIQRGRDVEFRCFGNSYLYQGNVSECNITQLFTKETSISESSSLIVLPKLTVSICNSTIAVPEATWSFPVKFSLPVNYTPVNVACNPVDSAVTELVIPEVNLNISSDFTRINYSLTNGSLTAPVKVSCTVKYIEDNQLVTSLPGNPGWFVRNEANVDLISSSLQVRSLTFKAFLVPKGLSGQDILIQCFSKTVHSQEEATAFIDSISCLEKSTTINSGNQTTTPAISSSTKTTIDSSSASQTTTTRTTPANSSTAQTTTPAINLMSPWLVNNPNFTLKAEGATLELKRQLPVQKPTLELVVLICCASITPGFQVLRKRKLILTTTVSLQPFVYYNQSELIPIDEIRPTPVGNPAKKSFANCPCDMTLNNCDVNCCCDMDCSPSDVDTFKKCIPGYQGAQQPPPPAWMCDTTSSDSNPKSFLCVLTQDSAFLGLYRHDKSAITDLIVFKTRWNPKRYSFSKTDSSAPADDNNFNQRYGNEIHTSIPNTLNSAPKILTLPQRIFSGQCATNAPVSFLTNINSDCVYQMTPDLCSDNSILSATSFVLSTALKTPPCPAAYAIHNGLDNQFVKTDVNYYCTSNSKPYLKSLDTLSDVFTRRLESSQNFTIPDACMIDSSGLYHCPENVEESLSARNEDLPPRCPWDDGFTRPDTPMLDTNSNASQCNNVVLSVQYQITWSGSKIEFLNASVILGNVNLFNVKQQKTSVHYSEMDPLTNVTVKKTLIRNTTLKVSTQLSPHYEVRYIHNFNNSKGDRSYSLPREKSGHPGYDFGKPIWSGTAVLNETSEEMLFVNQDETQQMRVWQPSPSGLCSLAGKRKISFGEDLFSSCVVPLNLDSLNDCENLRKWLFYQLSLLMPSDRIGRYGSNHASRSSDWIPVLRKNIHDRFPDIIPIPDFNATNITTENGTMSNDITIPSTTEPTLSNNQSDSSKGTCLQMPAGIVLDIMYAHTGLVYGMPIKEIIGARASYVFDNWTFRCAGNVFGGPCVSPDPESSEHYQLFTISSVVQFTQVPSAKPKPVIRYYEQSSSNKCWFDTCFEEIFNPFLKQPGEETVFYMQKVTITLILIFVCLVYIIILNI